jgi:RNA polymerase sigma-70 factor (ECF subfamily)
MTDNAVTEGPGDEELVAAFQQGDEQAFVTIVERYKHRLTRLAHSVVHNEEDALDVVQEALVKVYKGLNSFRSSSTLYTWLYRVVMNHAIDLVRRRGKVSFESTAEMVYELPDTMDAGRPDKESLRSELREMIFAAVDRLPEKQRSVILLREIEGLSYHEIADVIGCSEGTVMSRLYYGREQLRKMLEPYLRDGS